MLYTPGMPACVMVDMKRKFVRRISAGYNHRALRNLFLWISLLMLFGFAGRGTAEAADIQSGPFTSIGPGPQFAIADFDGDRRPDLASIQARPNTSGTTNYWIQLQLSAAGRQSIRIVGPVGGLLIEARDVNGDHAVDLVLSTAWRRQPVAIFLNDGHGHFSRAEPTAFPGAFSESKTNWGSASNQGIDAVGIATQSSVGIWLEARGLPHARSRKDSIPVSNAGFLLSSFLISHAGRAPPSEVLHF